MEDDQPKLIYIIGGIVIFVIIIFFGIYLINRVRNIIGSINLPSSAPQTGEQETTPLNEQVWTTYSSPIYYYTVSYPETFSHERTGDGFDKISSKGVTSSDYGTFDNGIQFLIDDGHFNTSFEDFIEKEKNKYKENPIVQNVGDTYQVNYSGLNGYGFEVRKQNLNEDYLYLLRGQNEYFLIIKNVQDPNRQNYNEIATNILESLRVRTS